MFAGRGPRLGAVGGAFSALRHDVAGDGEEGALHLVPGRWAVDLAGGPGGRRVWFVLLASALGCWGVLWLGDVEDAETGDEGVDAVPFLEGV